MKSNASLPFESQMHLNFICLEATRKAINTHQNKNENKICPNKQVTGPGICHLAPGYKGGCVSSEGGDLLHRMNYKYSRSQSVRFSQNWHFIH